MFKEQSQTQRGPVAIKIKIYETFALLSPIFLETNKTKVDRKFRTKKLLILGFRRGG
jgi:hypothetical protein